jgi:hypothetical protein
VTVPARASGYWAPRLDRSPSEWEDAIALSEATGRFAVADGASASFEAGRWARHLVAAFVAAPPAATAAATVDAWVAGCAAEWESERAGLGDATRPWYVDEAAVRGAFATFAGLELASATAAGGEVAWRCVAVGDCCLFHVRHGELLQAFPFERAHDFDDEPALLTSVAFGGHHGGRHAVRSSGTAQPGDALVLATDGLATWALARSIGGSDVWDLLARIDHVRFAELATRARRRGEMADDDVAMARCTIL